MSIKQRIFRGFLFIFGGKVGAGLLTVLITPFLVRILGSGGYGDYAFALAVYSTLRTVAGGGIYEGARKFIAEHPDPNRRTHVFHFYLKISALFGSIVLVLLIGITYVTVGEVILEERLRNYLYLVAVLVFLHPFFYLVRSSLMGYELEKYSESLVVFEKVLFAIIGLSLAAIGFHVTGVLLGHVAALFIVAILGYIAILRFTEIRMQDIRYVVPTTPSILSSDMFRYGILNVIFVILAKSLYNVDILLLQPFAGSQEVGYYRASLLFAEFVWFVPIAIQVILLHSSSKLWYENRIVEINAISSTITRYTLLLSVMLGLLLAIVGDEILPIYFGAEFTVSYLPLLLLLPGVIGFAVARPIYAISQGHGNMRLLVYSSGTASVINLVLNLLLIPQYGMHGAAVATSIGYGSMLVFHVWAARTIGFKPLSNIRGLRIALTCLLSFPIVIYVEGLITGTGLTLILVPPFAIVAFVVAAWITGAVDSQEVRNIATHVAQQRSAG